MLRPKVLPDLEIQTSWPWGGRPNQKYTAATCFKILIEKK